MLPIIKILVCACLAGALVMPGCVIQQPLFTIVQAPGDTPLPTTAPRPPDNGGTVTPAPTPSAAMESSRTPSTMDTINRNFISVAYGLGQTGLTKFDTPIVKVGVSGEYSAADRIFLTNFSALFNSISPTKIQYYWGFENEPVELIILPEQALKDIDPLGEFGENRNLTSRQVLFSCTFIDPGAYLQKRYYINKDAEMSRNYSLQRALLDALGFPGESDEPASFFNKDNDVSTALTEDDTTIIWMMYGLDIHENDTEARVKTFLH